MREPAADVKTSRLLETLSDSVRRETIRYFETLADGSVKELDALVSHLSDELPIERERLHLGLHHVHLPKLAAAGWLDYDHRTQQIRYHGNAEAADRLEALADLFDE